MNATTTRLPSPDNGLMLAGPQRGVFWLAATCYVISTVKFQGRDPLSTAAGFQGALEILLVMSALGLAALLVPMRTLWRHTTPTVLGFVLFAGFAMLSSVFSFFPQLSLVKGALLVATITIAAMLCAARRPEDVLTAAYRLIVVLMVLGTAYKLVSSQPLFDADEYSGRMRFTLFALHWGSLADYVAYTFLLGRLLPRRPHWSSQSFLLIANLAAGARASTGALAGVLLVDWLLNQKRITARGGAIAAFSIAGAAVLALIATNVDLPSVSTALERFYGDKVTLDEIVTLNNRTGLWAASLPLIPGTLVFGYGVEGMRLALLQEFDWAGHSHNAYLELLFASGLPGLVSFLVAWGSAVVMTFKARRDIRIAVLSLHAYMFLCGLTDPNLMLLQFFPVFVIVCLDAYVRANAAAPKLVQDPVAGRVPGALAWPLNRADHLGRPSTL